MRVKIKVQVKPYVRQYLLNQFGEDEAVIRSQSADPILCKMHDLLHRPERFYRYQIGEEYSETFTFIVPDWLEHTAGLELTPDKIISFNYFVDQLIKERLFILLDALQCYQKIKIKSVIHNYIDHNNMLEYGLTYEMLKKAYYRYRQSNTAKCWHIPLEDTLPKRMSPKNRRSVA